MAWRLKNRKKGKSKSRIGDKKSRTKAKAKINRKKHQIRTKT